MFKLLLISSLVVLCASSSFAMDRRDINEEQNYKLCTSVDPSWMNRFGRYIVDYDKNTAYNKCRKAAWPDGRVGAQQGGCYIKGHWYTAGYYCFKF